ncbi:uncharacterized protein LOC114355857 [Ostrinia furnacalis]|uniref:uncharacterized protein LOC114355857 n=1 Tax=Ostrinia furnacalis TaxID=93504 RepID=UPI001039AB3A|nr:uncharacterized protein LOC114355857 [Ostrinia furnacalis]
MLCQRCQRHLRHCEGVKCGQCESRFHLRCVSDVSKDQRNAGDRAYQWKCALCQNSEAKLNIENILTKEDTLLNAINAISEKFELVNKIQLPKLSNDLLQLKTIADSIAKQNEDILRKIDEYEAKKNKKEKIATVTRSESYRKRNFNLTTRNTKSTEHNDNVPMLLNPEKTVRYRPRRRSYMLNKMFNLLNRKLKKTTTPRKKI